MPIKRTITRERTTPESRFPVVETGGRGYIKEKYEDTGAILSITIIYKNALDEVVLLRNLATKQIIECIFKDYEQKDAYNKDVEIQRVTTHRPVSVEFPRQEFPLNHLRNYGPILHANSGITFSQTEVEI